MTTEQLIRLHARLDAVAAFALLLKEQVESVQNEVGHELHRRRQTADES